MNAWLHNNINIWTLQFYAVFQSGLNNVCMLTYTTKEPYNSCINVSFEWVWSRHHGQARQATRQRNLLAEAMARVRHFWRVRCRFRTRPMLDGWRRPVVSRPYIAGGTPRSESTAARPSEQETESCLADSTPLINNDRASVWSTTPPGM